jgi:hypothetical protein
MVRARRRPLRHYLGGVPSVEINKRDEAEVALSAVWEGFVDYSADGIFLVLPEGRHRGHNEELVSQG